MSRAEELLHRHCSIVEEYSESLKDWTNVDFYVEHVKKMQLPFSVSQASGKSAADAEALKLRRQELAKRLVEMNQRKREERVMNLRTKYSGSPNEKAAFGLF